MDPQFIELLNRLLKHFPSWEQVVMITVLFISWWIANKFFKDPSIGKFIGILASLASFAAIAWASVLRRKIEKLKLAKKIQRRIDALKEEGIPITHQNIYNKSIRPDVTIDD